MLYACYNAAIKGGLKPYIRSYLLDYSKVKNSGAKKTKSTF